MTEIMHITFEEDLVPETVTWANETKENGGISAFYVGHALSQIIERFPDNYHYVIGITEFLLDGAYLDKCLEQFSRKVLNELNAPKVSIDLSRSYLFSERLLHRENRTILTPSKRLETFKTLNSTIPTLIENEKLVMIQSTV